MSDLFAMLHTAFAVDNDTGEVMGMVTGISTVGSRLKVNVHVFNEDEGYEEDDPDPGEEEDVPEEEAKVADATIVEKIHMLKTGTGNK